MPFFANPRSFALNTSPNIIYNAGIMDQTDTTNFGMQLGSPSIDMFTMANSHESHPNFGHLCLLVFEAVMEVVFVSLPGYIVARQGLFDADAQKFVANLNVMVFTPCLVFNKLASQLTAEKLIDLAIIPLIFILQTLVSFTASFLISRAFRFKKRPQNFVTAMGVFGNSNSLPISLVISLSKTISGLHWDQIPGDNDDEVAARGILYLLIFQQLGQLLRWTWGYNVLLKPKEAYHEDETRSHARLEDGREHNGDEHDDADDDDGTETSDDTLARSTGRSGEGTPFMVDQSPPHSKTISVNGNRSDTLAPANGNIVPDHDSLPHDDDILEAEERPSGIRNFPRHIRRAFAKVGTSISNKATNLYFNLPKPIQTALFGIGRFFRGVWVFMNPPLWAMLAAIIVASIPRLQALFYTPGSFVNNSITRAVAQTGGVAVPLILVVLGANLARNTLPSGALSDKDPDDPSDRKLLMAALLSRMLIPTVIMAPIIAVVAKYVPVSILDDPIFVIVVFLLTGAPSALQLAQICQLNNVYMGAMSKLLFQSYVVWILPSTLVLVMLALEVVEWAQAG